MNIATTQMTFLAHLIIYAITSYEFILWKTL